MTNTQKHAVRELDILVKTTEEPIVEPFIPEILALCEKFGLSGQSGSSAPYTASALARTIKSLCLQEPICPITGHDDEWVDVTTLNNGHTLFQNNRCSAVFKESDGIPYYLDAIVWKDENDLTYTGSAIKNSKEVVKSRQFIKLPFTPKTFYIDVVGKEITGGDWEYYIKDVKQLSKVFKYYKKPINHA